MITENPHTNARYILFGNRARNQSPRGWVGENIIVNEVAPRRLEVQNRRIPCSQMGLRTKSPK
jgi:hypothetical protein